MRHMLVAEKIPFNAKIPSKPENIIRHDWQIEEVAALFALPFNDLMFKAQQIHREFFNPNQVQLSTLMSIKTGGCPEDCKYCPQSAKYDTGVKAEKISELEEVIEAAKKAKAAGATRFCMGAAWRSPKERDMEKVTAMVAGVKELGLETCVTLGMLTPEQTLKLKEAGLDYYNHNLDTSEEFYKEIITTRTYQDRLDTLANVRDAGIKVCCGGIVGMGEKQDDRASMLMTLANLPQHPESVPINMLVKIEGTPLGVKQDSGVGIQDSANDSGHPVIQSSSHQYTSPAIDEFDFIRTIAVARIMMPKSHIRLSAGREEMSEQTQALCFLAGANSVFYGDKLLTTPNPLANKDMKLFAKLGIEAE